MLVLDMMRSLLYVELVSTRRVFACSRVIKAEVSPFVMQSAVNDKLAHLDTHQN